MDYIAYGIAQTFKPVLHMIERLTGFHSFNVCKTLASTGILVNICLFFEKIFSKDETEIQTVMISQILIYMISIQLFGLILTLCKQNKLRWQQKEHIYNSQGIIEDEYKVIGTIIVILMFNLFIFKEDEAVRGTVVILYYESLIIWVSLCICSVKPYFSSSGTGRDERDKTVKEGSVWLLVSVIWVTLICLTSSTLLRFVFTAPYISISLSIMAYQIRRRKNGEDPSSEP